jgi:hypothetical protein
MDTAGERKVIADEEKTQITTTQKRSPSDFLKQALGRPVVVKLNSGVDYRGVPWPSCLLVDYQDVLA